MARPFKSRSEDTGEIGPLELGESSLHQNVVSQLRDLLMQNELPSGSKIPEAALCERFNVSRTPLREALKALAVEGFIQLRPNRGAIVAPIDLQEIEPIFEVKGALERLIGVSVAASATPVELEKLDELHHLLGKAVASDNFAEYTHLNYRFHRQLALATGNLILNQHYEMLQQRLWRYRFTNNENPERLRQSYLEHEGIMVALRARTPLDLADRLADHNRRSGISMIEAMSQTLASERRTTKIRGRSRNV